jgi:hypothetical protein
MGGAVVFVSVTGGGVGRTTGGLAPLWQATVITASTANAVDIRVVVEIVIIESLLSANPAAGYCQPSSSA